MFGQDALNLGSGLRSGAACGRVDHRRHAFEGELPGF
jgi:hypothetical protein